MMSLFWWYHDEHIITIFSFDVDGIKTSLFRNKAPNLYLCILFELLCYSNICMRAILNWHTVAFLQDKAVSTIARYALYLLLLCAHRTVCNMLDKKSSHWMIQHSVNGCKSWWQKPNLVNCWIKYFFYFEDLLSQHLLVTNISVCVSLSVCTCVLCGCLYFCVCGCLLVRVCLCVCARAYVIFRRRNAGILPSLEDLLFYTIAEGQEKIPAHKFISVSQRVDLPLNNAVLTLYVFNT